MTFIEKAHALIADGKIKEASTNILEDVINAVMGDPISTGKIIIALAKTPFFIREKLFWVKMEAFLNGVCLSDDDCAKLRAKLTKDGEKEDNAVRLVESIDKAETLHKVRYLINATNCFLADFIDRPTYFRVCHAITHTLDEDLNFLGMHIGEADIPYSPYTQGLLTSGLMYQSVIDGSGDQKYSFTPIARTLDQYAVSYGNVDRYPNPKTPEADQSTPMVSISELKWQTIEKAEVEKALSEI